MRRLSNFAAGAVTGALLLLALMVLFPPGPTGIIILASAFVGACGLIAARS